jgi:pseudaminic acid cytidylyltransferase
VKLCVIPARGGSKRIPRKNIKVFNGKPMIAYSIEAAIKSDCFDKIIVTTDDAEIASIAKQLGAEVPFIRPAELSDDYAGTTEVVAHATRWSIDQGWEVSAVCCIYATAPFVQVGDLDRGLKQLESGSWDYVFSATDFPSPIFRAFKQVEEGGVEMFFPEYFDSRSQDLPVALHDAGQFYWGRPLAWIEGRRIFDRHSTPVIIPRWRVQDIDNQDDWIRAELIYNQLKDRKV